MICKKCGHQFEGNFCNNCGTRANKKGGFDYDKTRSIIGLVSMILMVVFLAIFIFKSPVRAKKHKSLKLTAQRLL